MARGERGRAREGVGHLPNKGGPAGAGPPPQLPRQRRGIAPQMRGRYPDYDVLASAADWDAATRKAVLGRLYGPDEIRYFDDREAATLRALCDTVTAQHGPPRVPVLEMIDARLYAGRLDGFRHDDMPPDGETWRQVAASLDATARKAGVEGGFAAAPQELRHEIVERFSKGRLDWDLPVAKAWAVLTRMIVAAFYSHPWAWNEIGFGGPAYPRGFARLGPGQREHWEAPPEFEVDPVSDVRERGLE